MAEKEKTIEPKPTNPIKDRIKLLEENEKKLRNDLIKLDKIKNQTQQNLLVTVGGINELRLLLKPKEVKKPNSK